MYVYHLHTLIENIKKTVTHTTFIFVMLFLDNINTNTQNDTKTLESRANTVLI